MKNIIQVIDISDLLNHRPKNLPKIWTQSLKKILAQHLRKINDITWDSILTSKYID